MNYLSLSKNGIIVRGDDKQYNVHPPFFSLWNYRNLKNRSLIVGFVGARGSGKSVGGARLAITDFMLRGKTVWSNMEIGFNLVKNGSCIPVVSRSLEKMSLVDLDEVFENGLIYVDEVNLLAEARRAMSHENVSFSYILQQLRKRRLNIIWSAQSEMHCDDRLRFQTDIFIMCEDMSIKRPNCGIGELSLWKAYDYSGVIKGKTPRNSNESVFYEGVEWNKPWWNMYSTWQIQDTNIGNKDDNKSALRQEADKIAAQIFEYMEENEKKIRARELWRIFNVTEIPLMAAIGVSLRKYGVHKSNNERWYVLEQEYAGVD